MNDFEMRIHNVQEYDIHGSRITVWYGIEENQMIDFGQALMAMKNGYKVARAGWNGRNMHIYLLREHWLESGEVKMEPCIVMFTAQGLHQPGWLASQADMLAEDWEIVR